MSDIATKILNGDSLQSELVDSALRKELARREARRRADVLEREAKPIELLSEDEFNRQPPADFLVGGVIVTGSLVEIVGPSGSMKTFLTLDLGCRIAAGHPPWFD